MCTKSFVRWEALSTATARELSHTPQLVQGWSLMGRERRELSRGIGERGKGEERNG